MKTHKPPARDVTYRCPIDGKEFTSPWDEKTTHRLGFPMAKITFDAHMRAEHTLETYTKTITPTPPASWVRLMDLNVELGLPDSVFIEKLTVEATYTLTDDRDKFDDLITAIHFAVHKWYYFPVRDAITGGIVTLRGTDEHPSVTDLFYYEPIPTPPPIRPREATVKKEMDVGWLIKHIELVTTWNLVDILLWKSVKFTIEYRK